MEVPLNLWNKSSIRPGPVGSVGETNIQVRLKQSAPDLAPRYDDIFSKSNEKYFGSNVTDGQYANFTSGGGGAITLQKRMGHRQGFKTALGWIHEDLRPTDRARMTIMNGVDTVFNEQKATLQRAKTTGDMFLP